MYVCFILYDNSSLWWVSFKTFENPDFQDAYLLRGVTLKMRILRGLRVCLWRHLVVRSRNLGGLLLDLLLPCLLFLILGLLNALFGEHFGPTEHAEKSRRTVPLSEFGCSSLPATGSENGTRVYFSPNSSTAATLIMAIVRAWINQSCSYVQLCKLQFSL